MFPRAGDANALATSPLVVPGVIAINGTTINAIASIGAVGDGFAGGQSQAVGLAAFNSSTFDRLRTNNASIISAATQNKMLGVANPGQWSQFSGPAANTQATTSKAAGGAGVRHVLQAFSASLSSSAAAASRQTVNIRDGASGAGTIIWSFDLSIVATADQLAIMALSGLNIFGTANTAMTIEFAAAGGANTFENVSIAGYSTI